MGSILLGCRLLENCAVQAVPFSVPFSPGHLWVYRKDGALRHDAAKNAGVENWYFAIQLPTGEVDESFESELQRYETRADDLLRILPNECFVWSRAAREILAVYAALLFARARAKREGSDWLINGAYAELRAAAEDEDFVRELAESFNQQHHGQATRWMEAVKKHILDNPSG